MTAPVVLCPLPQPLAGKEGEETNVNKVTSYIVLLAKNHYKIMHNTLILSKLM